MSAAGVYQAWLCFVTEPEEGIERTDTIAGGRSRVIFDRSKKSCSKDRRACRYKAAFSDDAHARDRPCHSHGAGFLGQWEVSGCCFSMEVLGKEERMFHFRSFLKEEEGVGVVEIILILVVLISLVLIFKSQLTSLVKSIFGKIVSQSNGV